MSLYNGPPRGGTRGGADQFNWDNVKADPDREYYLGHSVKATTGRWQKGKDVFWYTREKQDDGGAAAAEMLAIKQREEDLMAEALGIKPRTLRPMAHAKLDKKDVAQLLSRGEEGEEPDPAAEADRIQGLGFAAGAKGSLDAPEREVLAGVGLERPLPPPPGLPGPPGSGPAPASSAGPGPGAAGAAAAQGALPGPPALPAGALKLVKKAQKRAAKEARKEERAAAKAARKAKKRAKRDKREREAASPPSPSAGSPDNAAPEGAESRKRGRSEEPQPRLDGRRAARHDSPSPDAGRARVHEGAHEHSQDASVARHAAHRRRHESPGAVAGRGRAHEASHERRQGASPPRHAARRQRHDSLSPDAVHGRADRHTERRSGNRAERGREGAGRRRHDTPSPPRRRAGRGSASPV